MPMTNASAEWYFSAMRRMKTYLQSTMITNGYFHKFKLLLKGNFFVDLVIRFITNRKYAFF